MMPTLVLPAPGARTGWLRTRLDQWLGMPVLTVAALACLVFCWVPATVADPDLWWHLRNVQEEIARHAVLRGDLYSFTAPHAAWINHEWLSEIPFYLGWRLLGAHGVYLVTLAAIEAIMLGVLGLAWLKSRSLVVSLAVTAVATALATVSFAPRTLLFGWLCLVVELLVLECWEEHRRLIWTLPPLFLVWVNLHGSWLIGMVLMLCSLGCGWVPIEAAGIRSNYLEPSARRRLMLACALSAGALLVNPYGWRLVGYPFDLAMRQRLNIAQVEEWRALDLHSPRGRILVLSLAVLFLLQIVRRTRWRLDELMFVGIGAYAAFTYSRFLFLAGILVMPVLGRQLACFDCAQHRREQRPFVNLRLNLLLLGLLLGFVVERLPSREQAERTLGQSFPAEALPWLKGFKPQGPVFNEFLWGGFLEWHVRQIPVFIDSRVDLFEYNGTFRDYLEIIHLHRSLELLDRYKIRYVLFERDAPLVYLLEQSQRWAVDYQDGTTVLLERKGL